LSESINAVTWGSLQIFAELEGVDPGAVAPGVCAPEVGNCIGAVDVTAGNKVGKTVGVEAAFEEGLQAVSRTKPDRSMGTSFIIIVLSFCRTAFKSRAVRIYSFPSVR
jgi:hypothetical protein